MIDAAGFRQNIGIILVNAKDQLLLARRKNQDAWQFPQGGIKADETCEQALYRELKEEIGLSPEDIEIITHTRKWLYYRLPSYLIRAHTTPVCIGQKQKWYLLKFLGDDTKIYLHSTLNPEFDDWKWVSYWEPMEKVVHFKRVVYRKALTEFESFVFPKKS